MAVWKIASNILVAWVDRCSNRNENRTWADRENIFKIFADNRSGARKIFHGLVLMSFFREAASSWVRDCQPKALYIIYIFA